MKSPPEPVKTVKPGESLPARGAWVEITSSGSSQSHAAVAPREGGVG